MKRLNGPIGICQGSHVLFADFLDGGPMWAGTGVREKRFAVTFKQGFVAPPAVTVGLSMWDMGANSNQRVDLTADHITTLGFDLVFRTWSDTKIARVRADWLAIGALHDDDRWDID